MTSMYPEVRALPTALPFDRAHPTTNPHAAERALRAHLRSVALAIYRFSGRPMRRMATVGPRLGAQTGVTGARLARSRGRPITTGSMGYGRYAPSRGPLPGSRPRRW